MEKDPISFELSDEETRGIEASKTDFVELDEAALAKVCGGYAACNAPFRKAQ